jgi:hypothetical protein
MRGGNSVGLIRGFLAVLYSSQGGSQLGFWYHRMEVADLPSLSEHTRFRVLLALADAAPSGDGLGRLPG